MCGSKRAPFWDQSFDRDGKAIRADVRKSAQEVWARACCLAVSVLGDSSDAAEIMESCVARVSRYLDRRNAGAFTQQTNGLLLVAFRNQLYSHAAKLRRTKPVGHATEIAAYVPDAGWHEKVDRQLELIDLVRQLSKRNLMILRLRIAGYGWKEVAVLFSTTPADARNGFWRELQQLQSKIANVHTKPVSQGPRPPNMAP
jgi:DNA-directed RNA polymerase specialized sigma24 family protein